MENLRRNFFNGAQEGDRKIAWVKWHIVLAAKQFGGLGVSSFFALNRGLLAKWVWRFLSQDNSLWYQVISTINGSVYPFWKGLVWIDDHSLLGKFPRLYALETNKDISVADKLHPSLSFSWRRSVRGGIESQQFNHLSSLLDSVSLSNSEDRWVCDLSGDEVFELSEKQEELVKQSWELMKEDIADLSLYFFTQILEIAPAAKGLFSFLKDADEIPENNPKLKAHAIKVFKMTCEAAIQLREKGEVVVSGSTLKYLGSVHLQKGVVAPQFEVLY
ncbi:non-symbiotic hemoglobin 2 [Tanacetum coccineum]